jgi:hypothetical protein
LVGLGINTLSNGLIGGRNRLLSARPPSRFIFDVYVHHHGLIFLLEANTLHDNHFLYFVYLSSVTQPHLLALQHLSAFKSGWIESTVLATVLHSARPQDSMSDLAHAPWVDEVASSTSAVPWLQLPIGQFSSAQVPSGHFINMR